MTNEIFALYVARALVALRPDAQWSINDDHQYEDIEWLDTEQTKPTKVQIEAKIQEIQAAWEALEYQRQRAVTYPKFDTQLDMLYHDIKNGTLDSGSWVTAIEAVKQQFPKGV